MLRRKIQCGKAALSYLARLSGTYRQHGKSRALYAYIQGIRCCILSSVIAVADSTIKEKTLEVVSRSGVLGVNSLFDQGGRSNTAQ